MKEYLTKTVTKKRTLALRVNAGVYKNANDLFAQFREIRMRQLSGYKVLLQVPEGYDVEFDQGLKNLLGFVGRRFETGSYISSYPVELDVGIVEIFVHSDIVSSSHEGESHEPLLRIIPCSNEKGEQTVKHH